MSEELIIVDCPKHGKSVSIPSLDGFCAKCNREKLKEKKIDIEIPKINRFEVMNCYDKKSKELLKKVSKEKFKNEEERKKNLEEGQKFLDARTKMILDGIRKNSPRGGW